jgi:hypothetical protein
MNFIQQEFVKDLPDFKIFPFQGNPDRVFTITFEGWKIGTLILDYDHLSPLIKMTTHTLRAIIETYKDTHAFSQPDFFYRPQDGSFGLKIAIMKNERYEELMEKIDGV